MPRRLFSNLVLALVLSLTAVGAWAQFRTIPPDAKRGVMSHVEGMTIQLDANQVQLAPGAQIRDGRNMMILPTTVPPGILVKYLVDDRGQVTRVWILSPDEAAQPDPIPPPVPFTQPVPFK